ncbi:MAG: hypothetical protein QM529_02960 [Hydrotalea sp.]|nr:hypothetical protein [Hydrotalea sp.]
MNNLDVNYNNNISVILPIPAYSPQSEMAAVGVLYRLPFNEEFNKIKIGNDSSRNDILNILNYLSQLHDNWNGHGVIAPTLGAITMAKLFINKIPFNKRYPDKIEPASEGDISFIWKSDKKRLIITLDGFFAHFSFEEKDKEIEFEDNIPLDCSDDGSKFIIDKKILEKIY